MGNHPITAWPRIPTFETRPPMQRIRHIRSHQPFSEWAGTLVSRHGTLWILVWKDLKVQYGNMLAGLVWSVFQPLVYLGAIALLFSLGGRRPFGTASDPLVFLFAGIIVWNFITNAVNFTLTSIQGNSNIISKAFFPRFFLVLAPVLRVSLDFIIAFLILMVMAVSRGTEISISLLWNLPIAAALLLSTAVGLASLAAVAVVMNRHLRHVIPMLMYTGLFIFPVFHRLEGIGSPVLSTIYMENPIAMSMALMRSGFGHEDFSIPALTFAFSVAIAILFIGILSFRRMERTMADRI